MRWLGTATLTVLLLGSQPTAASVAAGSAALHAQQPGPIRILLAKRGRAIRSPFGEYAPANSAADVMLLIRVSGVAEGDPDEAEEEVRYVTAGDRRCEVQYTFRFESGELELAFAVPRAVVNLSLVLGTAPALRFTADAAISAELESPGTASSAPQLQ